VVTSSPPTQPPRAGRSRRKGRGMIYMISPIALSNYSPLISHHCYGRVARPTLPPVTWVYLLVNIWLSYWAFTPLTGVLEFAGGEKESLFRAPSLAVHNISISIIAYSPENSRAYPIATKLAMI